MDYLGVMYLANFIKNEVDDRQEAIDGIYKNAVQESESFKELEELKNRIIFFDNGAGGTLFKECNELMRDIYASPDNNRDILYRMKNLAKDIRTEEARSMKVLEELGADGLCLVDKETGDRFGKALNILASSLIYMLLITEGAAGIDGLSWNGNNSLNVKLAALNNDILGRLSGSATDIFFWKMMRAQDDRTISFCGYRYQVEYISYEEYLAGKEAMKPIGDNLYMAGFVAEEDALQTVYVGMGNIVPCRARECIERLKDNRLVKDDYFGQVTEEVAAYNDKGLLNLLEIMSEGKMYVVSPRKACDLMNQFVNAREIHYRKRRGLCLFCGRKLISGLVCKGHFDTHKRVYYQ
ncbi:MAG: hypothetical protein IJ661_05995 [Lachnospiraceae bacterium]|nr:hypothetical protein [Lachnospiraceae bacterium]